MNVNITSITTEVNGGVLVGTINVVGTVTTNQTLLLDLTELEERVLELETNKVDSLKLDW